MKTVYDATQEHVNLRKQKEEKLESDRQLGIKQNIDKDRIGRHPNKGLTTRHPVSGK